jgi:hypothetical protein
MRDQAANIHLLPFGFEVVSREQQPSAWRPQWVVSGPKFDTIPTSVS